MESDLSALHRIDDMNEQDAARMTRLALLLPNYQGAVRARAMVEHAARAERQKILDDRDALRSGDLAGIVS